MTPEEKQAVRTETIRELDAKYKAICEQKMNAAIDYLEKKLWESQTIIQRILRR